MESGSRGISLVQSPALSVLLLRGSLAVTCGPASTLESNCPTLWVCWRHSTLQALAELIEQRFQRSGGRFSLLYDLAVILELLEGRRQSSPRAKKKAIMLRGHAKGTETMNFGPTGGSLRMKNLKQRKAKRKIGRAHV